MIKISDIFFVKNVDNSYTAQLTYPVDGTIVNFTPDDILTNTSLMEALFRDLGDLDIIFDPIEYIFNSFNPNASTIKVKKLLGSVDETGATTIFNIADYNWGITNIEEISDIKFLTNAVIFDGTDLSSIIESTKTITISNCIFSVIASKIYNYKIIDIISSNIVNLSFIGDLADDTEPKLSISNCIMDINENISGFVNVSISDSTINKLNIINFKDVLDVETSLDLKNINIELATGEILTVDNVNVISIEGCNIDNSASALKLSYYEKDVKAPATFINIFDSNISTNLITSSQELKIYNTVLNSTDVDIEVSKHAIISSSTISTVGDGVLITTIDDDKYSCQTEIIGNIFHVSTPNDGCYAVKIGRYNIEQGLYSGIVAFNAFSKDSVDSSYLSDAIIAEMKPNRILRFGSNIVQNFTALISDSATGVTTVGNYITESVLTEYLSQEEFSNYITINNFLTSEDADTIVTQQIENNLPALVSDYLVDIDLYTKLEIDAKTVKTKSLLVKNNDDTKNTFILFKAEANIEIISIEGYIVNFQNGALLGHKIPALNPTALLCASLKGEYDETISEQIFTTNFLSELDISNLDNMFNITPIAGLEIMEKGTFLSINTPICNEIFLQVNYKIQ